ncbi:MAG: hypothetical protein M1818_006334 [Claussenomyces sp. TS43310]|nr:MAG: hypothetical protein M1818_006334 [Claussenomyces sp. TS43310]
MTSVIQLECQCNNYPWGRKGKDSLAAQYAAATPGGSFKLDESKEYAEMWMGTYPTTPSLILSSGEDLQKHLNANKEKLIGKPILSKLARVGDPSEILSIAKALPLQIHPNKDIAAKLHKKDPKKFGDSNHKPEIAVALGKFEVFVGWKPLQDIDHLFTKIPILKTTFTKDAGAPFTFESVKEIVLRILSASDETIAEVYAALRKLPVDDFGPHSSYIPALLPRLAEQYDKSDPGILVALLTMNFLVLDKGDAIYVPADGIHAYLSGDIVECMARSDNVLNTGFCPRADRDSVEIFTAALEHSPKSASDAKLKPERSDKGRHGKTKVLAPPMSEFNMLITALQKQESETIAALQGPSILVVTAGEGVLRAEGKDHQLREGYVFFIGCGTELELLAQQGLETHIAYSEA